MSFVLFILSALLVVDAIGSYRMLADSSWTFLEEVFLWLFIATKCVVAVLIWL